MLIPNESASRISIENDQLVGWVGGCPINNHPTSTTADAHHFLHWSLIDLWPWTHAEYAAAQLWRDTPLLDTLNMSRRSPRNITLGLMINQYQWERSIDPYRSINPLYAKVNRSLVMVALTVVDQCGPPTNPWFTLIHCGLGWMLNSSLCVDQGRVVVWRISWGLAFGSWLVTVHNGFIRAQNGQEMGY